MRTNKIHQIWIGTSEMHPRYAAYCETVNRAFPEWEYKLWADRDIEHLAKSALMPNAMLDSQLNIGMRSDIIRLEILRQHGGVYFDVDFEILTSDLTPLIQHPDCFYYGDEKSGRPGSGFLAALNPGNPFVELYLNRIAGNLRKPKNNWEVVEISGPGRLAECLNFWVGDWTPSRTLDIGDGTIGNFYAADSICGIWHEILYPYYFDKGTWATFNPSQYPKAIGAHHWGGTWQ